MYGLNWFGCCVGCQNWLDFSAGDRHWLGFWVAVENELFLGSRSIWVFVSGHRNRLDIRVGIEFDLISVIGSKLTRFLCAWRKLLFMDRNYLVFHGESNIICFLRAGRKWPIFSVGIDWLSFCAGGRNWVVLDAGRKSLGSSLSMQITLVFVWVFEIDLIWVWGIELECSWEYEWNPFGCCLEGRNWPDFRVGGRRWLGFCPAVENDLFSGVDLN